ncbi:MAG: D-alanine--D-alanine ligase [Ignavibacteriaceae bacterium]|nr:D-alanine--D-alanine ligase [Ignavibacteriaceae bacterium]
MKTIARILICYNSPVSLFSIYNGKPITDDSIPNDLSESGFSKEIHKIKRYLLENFTEVNSFAINSNVERTINKLNAYSPDAIFNFVESIDGVSSYEYCLAGLFEMLGFDFTGNLPASLGNCLNKAKAKTILRSFGINTPDSMIIKIGQSDRFNSDNFVLKFPVILKLLNEDASIGISELSVVNDYDSLNKHISFLKSTYCQDILAEEYIDGRELNIAVLGNKALPISEIKFDGLPKGLPQIVTYDGKWIADSIYYENTKPSCPAQLNPELRVKIEETAILAFNAMDCRDYARVDMRLNRMNIPYVIEVNPNPDISMDSGFARAAAAAGMSYSDLLFTITGFALKRKNYDTKIKAG